MKIYFITTNPEKLKEAKIILAPYGYEVVGKSFDFVEPTEGSMESIAIAKLLQIKNELGSSLPTFVDDSGIYFDAYSDFPGILTRRVFNMIGYKGIEKLLHNENRKAFFYGVIAFMYNEDIKIFHGETNGSIIEKFDCNLSEGLRFPFDPIFIPEGLDITLGEMTVEEKLKYSYRKKALSELGKWLNTNMDSVYNN